MLEIILRHPSVLLNEAESQTNAECPSTASVDSLFWGFHLYPTRLALGWATTPTQHLCALQDLNSTLHAHPAPGH